MNNAAMLDLILTGRRLTLDSPLPLDEVTQRLRREVAPPVVWKLVEDRTQLFEGTFENGRFSMVRLVRGRNSFRPLIEGTLQPGGRGTRIDVRLKLNPLVVIICVAILAVGTMVGAVAIPALVSNTDSPAPLLVFVGGAAALGAVFFIAPGVEARAAARLLQDLFEAEPTGAGDPGKRTLR
jgi:hypothetical protein